MNYFILHFYFWNDLKNKNYTFIIKSFQTIVFIFIVISTNS